MGKYPLYTIFRHTDNHKWFALIINIDYATLKIDHPGQVDLLNLKCGPNLIQILGIIPAYHMNKTHWISALLDHTVPAEQIRNLINLSYQLTN